jgi:two-component system sensor kinase FixL
MLSSELQALMDAAVDAVILIDHEGRISAVNRSAERLFGYAPDELLGKNVSVLMPDPNRSSHDAYLARYAATGVAHIIGVGRELPAQRKDTSIFPAFVSVGRVPASEPPRFVGFVRDVTPQHQAMAMIQAERDRANAYLELGHAILLTLDAEHRMRVVNRRCCDLLGADENELLGRDWFECAIPPGEREQVRAHVAQALALPPDATHSFQCTVRGYGAEPRYIAWRCVALRNADAAVTGLLCAGDDITDRRRGEEEARRSSERMIYVSRLATMGEMAAGIAHELNQPLTAVTNYARACERFLAAAEPDLVEARAALQEIGSEALRAGDIIRGLRRMVRDQDTQRIAASLNEIVQELWLLTQADARVHNIRIKFDLTAGLPQVDIDRVQIQQVLLNLIRNALEALLDVPAGARHVTVRTSRADDGQVEVSVCDDGPGVAPEIVERMFEPFCTTKAKGTGLGLAISRTIVRAHGGTINYRPANPAGECFSIQIPPLQDAE